MGRSDHIGQVKHGVMARDGLIGPAIHAHAGDDAGGEGCVEIVLVHQVTPVAVADDGLLLHELQLPHGDHVAVGGHQRHHNHQHVALPQHVFLAGEVLRAELLFHFLRRPHQVEIDDLGVEAAQPPGYLTGDVAEADEAHGLAVQLSGDCTILEVWPLAGLGVGLQFPEMAIQRQHLQDLKLRYCDAVAPGDNGHGDAKAVGTFHVHVVDANARALDHAQARGLLDELPGDTEGGVDGVMHPGQGLGALRLGHLVPVPDVKALGLQSLKHLHIGVGRFVQIQNISLHFNPPPRAPGPAACAGYGT